MFVYHVNQIYVEKKRKIEKKERKTKNVNMSLLMQGSKRIKQGQKFEKVLLHAKKCIGIKKTAYCLDFVRLFCFPFNIFREKK